MTAPPPKKQKLSVDEHNAHEHQLGDGQLQEQPVQENQPQPDRFSTLPAEMRNAIYAQLLARPQFSLIVSSEPMAQTPFGLLGASQQIREEFRRMLRTAVREHEWVFDDATDFTTVLRLAPRWLLRDIRRVRLCFSAAEAIQFWSGGTGNKHEDPETSCVDFDQLTGLQFLEVNFRGEEEEEDFYDTYGGYDGVVQDAIELMKLSGHVMLDESLVELQLTGDISDEVRQWAEEEEIVHVHEDTEEQDDDYTR